MFKNFGLPTDAQWQKVATAFIFAFISTFLAVLTAAGGITTDMQANFALASSAMVAGINAGLYALYITFFKSEIKG